MRNDCQTAADKEPARDEAQGIAILPFGEAIDRLAALQEEIFGGTTLPGDSADFIRDAREVRTECLNGEKPD